MAASNVSELTPGVFVINEINPKNAILKLVAFAFKLERNKTD